MSSRVPVGRLRPGHARGAVSWVSRRRARAKLLRRALPPPAVRLFHVSATPLPVLSHAASLRGFPCPPRTCLICTREVHALRCDVVSSDQCGVSGAHISASLRRGSVPHRPPPPRPPLPFGESPCPAAPRGRGAVLYAALARGRWHSAQGLSGSLFPTEPPPPSGAAPRAAAFLIAAAPPGAQLGRDGRGTWSTSEVSLLCSVHALVTATAEAGRCLQSRFLRVGLLVKG